MDGTCTTARTLVQSMITNSQATKRQMMRAWWLEHVEKVKQTPLPQLKAFALSSEFTYGTLSEKGAHTVTRLDGGMSPDRSTLTAAR